MSTTWEGRRNALRDLALGDRRFAYYALASVDGIAGAHGARLPFSLRIFLENLIRHDDGGDESAAMIGALATWDGRAADEIAFYPHRIVAPDSSGIPLMADLTAMREAMQAAGGDPLRVNPRIPVDLIVDHSVVTRYWASDGAFAANLRNEFAQNGERYAFLKWAAGAYENFRVVPPGAGIIHQVNLEYLASPVVTERRDNRVVALPDSLVGLDSHTPMINALGIPGWGVGGIEAAAAVLGAPLTIPIPRVVGCRLVGRLRAGVTSTDLVLTVTEKLRRHGVTGAIVEFAGEGARRLTLQDRATLANMAPEYGATMGFFPVDGETLRYLRLTGRDEGTIALTEAYARAQGLWADVDADVIYSDTIEIDLGKVETSMSGPRRPQDRHRLGDVAKSFRESFPAIGDADRGALDDGSVVIAAITSCTNTSNPAVLVGAGLMARKAVERGLAARPWVKTSFSPGSRVTADYLARSGLQAALDALGFQVTGFGCMTCGGGAGPLADWVEGDVAARQLTVGAVLSANRNFDGRIHAQVKAAYIGSPALVVAYAIAGSLLVDVENEPLGNGSDGRPVYLRDIWPSDAEIAEVVAGSVKPEMFAERYRSIFTGNAEWQALPGQAGAVFAWDGGSSYLRRPPFFDLPPLAGGGSAIVGARALLVLGDTVTTDHISPVGPIPADGPAGRYLAELGVAPAALHSFLSRRVNHDVMLRGTFANPRLRNEAVPGSEGGVAVHLPDGAVATVDEVAARYRAAGVPQIVVAGKEYGTGSSRDWAAKGTRMLGVAAVVAESFERIHRSNLVGMGVLPLQFQPGEDRTSLRIDGTEEFDIRLPENLEPNQTVEIRIRRRDGSVAATRLLSRLDTWREIDWYRAGGVLNHMLASLLGAPAGGNAGRATIN